MIYEYAIDPLFFEEISDNGNKDLAQNLRRHMGKGYCCITSGYPENLDKIGYKIIKEKLDNEKDDERRARLQGILKNFETLVKNLTETTTKRYNSEAWNGCFYAEHKRLPFEGILSTNSQAQSLPTLPLRTIEWLRDEDCHIFNCPRNRSVQQHETALIKELTPLLRNASDITFVDPYFYPETKYEKPYKGYFKLISDVAHIRSTETRGVTLICAVDKSKKAIDTEAFRRDCQKLLPPWLPVNLRLIVRRIDVRPGGQLIHNRYILTDIGGVLLAYGTGLPPYKKSSSRDDIFVLDAGPLQEWKKAYRPDSPDFDWSEPPVIISK